MVNILPDVCQAVRDAGKLILSAHNIDSSIEIKPGDANFVTAYDVAVQKMLEHSLYEIFPEAAFIGEESGNNKGLSDTEYRFIVDPIDGTTNFINGFRHSAVSVGLCYGNEPVMGVILNPYQDELFYAEKGTGAFCNGKSIHTAHHSLSQSVIGIGTTPYVHEKAHDTFRIAEAMFNAGLDIRRLASAALDLAYVACGRYDVFYELRLYPWDYAAGACIVTEAGGVISKMDGTSIDLNAPASILAGCTPAYAEVRQIIDSIGIFGL